MPTVLQRNKGRPKMFAIRTLGERQEGKLTLSTKWLTFFLQPPDGVFSLKGHRKLDAYLKLGPTDRIWEQTLSEKIKLWMVFFSPAYIGQKRLSLWYCSVKVASVVSHQICREFQKVDKYYSSPHGWGPSRRWCQTCPGSPQSGPWRWWGCGCQQSE